MYRGRSSPRSRRSLSFAWAMSRATTTGPVSSSGVETGCLLSSARISFIERLRSIATPFRCVPVLCCSGMRRRGRARAPRARSRLCRSAPGRCGRPSRRRRFPPGTTPRGAADGSPSRRDYVYNHANPKGWVREQWWHERGCRRWIIVERNTLTHEIAGRSRLGVEAFVTGTDHDTTSLAVEDGATMVSNRGNDPSASDGAESVSESNRIPGQILRN